MSFCSTVLHTERERGRERERAREGEREIERERLIEGERERDIDSDIDRMFIDFATNK